MNFLFQTLLYILFLNAVFCDEDGTEIDERDPLEKSSDSYSHQVDNADANLIDGVSESEVHYTKSKVYNKNLNRLKKHKISRKRLEKKQKIHAKKKSKKERLIGKRQKQNKADKIEVKQGRNISPSGIKNDGKDIEKIDRKSQEQFADAEETKDPAINKYDDEDESDEDFEDEKASQTKEKKRNKAHKKHFNYHGDFYPGSLWEYPYPYFHPIYSCRAPVDCSCEKEEELKVEGKPDEAPAPCEAKPDGKECGGEAPPAIKVKQAKAKQRQLVPSHYYGPPSAGWGGFQPGQTGCGWGVPYWLKRQIVPSHYYGPSNFGWGDLQPGQTGEGWGAPYRYRKRYGIGKHAMHPKHRNKSSSKSHSHHRQLIPSHYYGPPSTGWGSFQPGQTGEAWGTPDWYKSHVEGKVRRIKHVTASRKFSVVGKDRCGLEYTSACGWDSGFGAVHTSTWGAPNIYGWSPAAQFHGGTENVDFRAWFGPKSFGKEGWGGSGWVGNLGKGVNNQIYLPPGTTSGWAIGRDMGKLDETIGAVDMMKANQGAASYSPNVPADFSAGNMGGFSMGSFGSTGIPDGHLVDLTTGAEKLKDNSNVQSIGYLPQDEAPSIESKENENDIKQSIEAKEDKSLHQEEPEDIAGTVKSFHSPSDLMYQPSAPDITNYSENSFVNQFENQQEESTPENPDGAEIIRDPNENTEDISYQQQISPDSADISRPGLPQLENNYISEGMQTFDSRVQQRPTPETNEENGAELSEEISEIMSQKPFKKPKSSSETSKVTKAESSMESKEGTEISNGESPNEEAKTAKMIPNGEEVNKSSEAENSTGNIETNKISNAEKIKGSKETSKVSGSENSVMAKDIENASSSAIPAKEINQQPTIENLSVKDKNDNIENKEQSDLSSIETKISEKVSANNEAGKTYEKTSKLDKNKKMSKLKLSTLKESPMKKIEKKLKEVATSAIDIASKIKQTEQLKKQEEAYSTIKSDTAKHPSRKLYTAKNEKSIPKSNMLRDDFASSRTVKTKAQNEKPVTI